MGGGVSPVADLLRKHGVAVVTVEGPLLIVGRQVSVQGHRVAEGLCTILTGQGRRGNCSTAKVRHLFKVITSVC